MICPYKKCPLVEAFCNGYVKTYKWWADLKHYLQELQEEMIKALNKESFWSGERDRLIGVKNALEVIQHKMEDIERETEK